MPSFSNPSKFLRFYLDIEFQNVFNKENKYNIVNRSN